MSKNQLEAISKAIGPAPWYFETFPAITGGSGQRFIWWERWTSNPDAKIIVLGPEPGPGPFRLAVHMYVRAFLIPPAKVGLWYERDGRIRILGFDPDHLADFTLSELPTEFKDPRKWLHYAIGRPEFELELDLDLPEGVHRLNAPAALQSINELLVVATRPAGDGVRFARYEEDDPAYAIWALQPAKGQVQVFPQKWFTTKQFDLGYEWITRVARDSETGRLIGDGIRIGPFELTEDGCHLAHWLSLYPYADRQDRLTPRPKREAQFMVESRSYPCPCCGYLVFSEAPGSHEICPICYWEDDISQLRFVRSAGANHISLIEGQENYTKFGACEERFRPRARSPKPEEARGSGWRPVNSGSDKIEDPVPGADYGESYPEDSRQLYYWRDTYWRKGET